MIYKKELLLLISIIISTGAKVFTPISYEEDKTVAASSVRNVRKVDPLKETKQLVKNVDFSKLFKNLRHNHSPEEVRIVGTLGLLAGALHAEEAMRENLYHMTDDLLDKFNKSTPKENMHKLLAIEETIIRDKSAISILNGMLRFARNGTTLDALEKDMQHILHENEASSKRLRNKKLALGRDDESDGQKSASTGKLITRSGLNLKYSVKEKLYDVREMIDNHVENIHSSVTDNAKQTIKYVQKMQKNDGKLMQTNTKRKIKLDPSLVPVRRLWDQVASPESSDDDFDVDLNYQQVPRQASRIVDEPRLTKGEELIVITSKPKANLVNTKLDRFRRHNRQSDADKSFVVDVDLGFDGPKMSARQDDDDNDKDNEIDSSKSQGDQDKSEQKEEEFDEESSSQSEGQGGLVGLISNLSGGDEGSDVGAVLGALSQVVTNLLGPGGLDIPGLVSSGTALLSSLLAGEENFGKVLGNIVGLAIDGFSGGGGAANNGQFFGQFLGKFVSVLSADPDDDDAPIRPAEFIENLYDGIGKGSAKPAEREGEEANPDCGDKGGGSDSSGFIHGILSGLLSVITKASAGSSAGLSQGSIQGVTGLSGGSSSGSSGSSSALSGKGDGRKR